jgi:hypothetical protein
LCLPRGRGSVGRASPCQGEGRGFESRRPLRGPGQMAFFDAGTPCRASPSKGEGREVDGSAPATNTAPGAGQPHDLVPASHRPQVRTLRAARLCPIVPTWCRQRRRLRLLAASQRECHGPHFGPTPSGALRDSPRALRDPRLAERTPQTVRCVSWIAVHGLELAAARPGRRSCVVGHGNPENL